MSFLSKLFLILSILTSLLFFLIAAALLAKQQNFQARYGKELIERQRDERLQDLLRHHLAAVKDKNQRDVLQARNKMLIAASGANVAVGEQQQIEETLMRVREAVNEFSVGLDFNPIQQDFNRMLDSLVERTRQLSERGDEIVGHKAQLQLHLASAEGEVARLREGLNVLDRELYELERSNMQNRETINRYMEADDSLTVPGVGGPLRPSGRIAAVNAARGVVVIDVGANEEVQPHMVLSVIDAATGEYIVQVEVLEVDELSSTARILDASASGGAVTVGDYVRPRAAAGR